MSLSNAEQFIESEHQVYATTIGPDCGTLIFAKDSDWMQQPEEKLYLACECGHVDLEEMR